jgi:hypothetical protein
MTICLAQLSKSFFSDCQLDSCLYLVGYFVIRTFTLKKYFQLNVFPIGLGAPICLGSFQKVGLDSQPRKSWGFQQPSLDKSMLSLDEKLVIFHSAKNFRYFFRFWWQGRKRKCHNNFSFILPAEKKTRFAMQKFYFLWYFNYFLTNEASCKKNIWKSQKKFGRIYGRKHVIFGRY